jgi:hypothetical protein
MSDNNAIKPVFCQIRPSRVAPFLHRPEARGGVLRPWRQWPARPMVTVVVVRCEPREIA